MPRASMGGSTIRTAAGKAADCGARTAIARPGSRKAARAQCHAPCTSSFGPIRWRIEVRGKFERPVARNCDAFAQSYVPGDRGLLNLFLLFAYRAAPCNSREN